MRRVARRVALRWPIFAEFCTAWFADLAPLDLAVAARLARRRAASTPPVPSSPVPAAPATPSRAERLGPPAEWID